MLTKRGPETVRARRWPQRRVVFVQKGEIFVVMGPPIGQATAIRTVNKLHDVTHGQVLVDDQLEGKELQALRREKMGMVFQHFALPHRNVIDNVAYGLSSKGRQK